MERKRSRDFYPIFTEAFDRLFKLGNVNDCPEGLVSKLAPQWLEVGEKIL